jgi:exodeoxyribonuclease-1
VLRTHLGVLRSGALRNGETLAEKLGAVFSGRDFGEASDVDGRLYDAFFSNSDKQVMDELHQMSDWDLADWAAPFQDSRGEEMLFRYRARNYPDTLNEDERERWELHRTSRLMNGVAGKPVLTFAEFAPLLEQAAMSVANDPNPNKLQWIHELQLYAESIYPVTDF